MKVRIVKTPREPEVDGVRLDRFTAGAVHEVSPILGAWLVAEGYAAPEMRKTVEEYEEEFSSLKERPTQAMAHDHPRRRRSDR